MTILKKLRLCRKYERGIDLFIKEGVPISFSEAIKLGERIKIEHKLLEVFDFAHKYNDINDLLL